MRHQFWIGLAVVAALAWLPGCGDHGPCASGCTQQDLVASDPVPAALVLGSQATLPGVQAASRTQSSSEEVVFISLPPGTVPAGTRAIVFRVGADDTLSVPVIAGGVDPVPVEAQDGDSIVVLVTGGSGGTFGVRAVARRPPVVVGTRPPRKKRDVPLNASIVIVFSEPVAPATLTGTSVKLLRGTSAISGVVSLVQGNGAVAAFTPDVPLAANTTYRLLVTRAVEDREGDALTADFSTSFTTGQSSTGPPASIELWPLNSADSIILGETTYQLTATVRDAGGNELPNEPVTWSTNDPQRLSVSANGVLTALQTCDLCSVTASVNNGVSRTVRVSVHLPGPPLPPQGVVEIAPPTASVAADGDTVQLVATVKDASGNPVEGISWYWSSSNTERATVRMYGDSVRGGRVFATVTGRRTGSVTISVIASGSTFGSGGTGSASVTVTPALPVTSVTVTPPSASIVPQGSARLIASIRDTNGKVVGGGSAAWATDNAAVATVDTNGTVTGVAQGTARISAKVQGFSDTATVTVRTISFVSVTARFGTTCGLITTGEAFCWGVNNYGELGNPRPPVFAYAPTVVSGGLTFTSVSAGGEHTCALATGGAAYCWGRNLSGSLGDGTTVSRWAPRVVSAGPVSFAAVSDGSYCALETGGAGYCWGPNSSGQLGIGTTSGPQICSGSPCSTVPVQVSGGPFTTLSSGALHNCGLTSNGSAYCWGENTDGQLGTGSTTPSSLPVQVSGGLTFATISTGSFSTCGVTTGGDAYCWGRNSLGQLGNGNTAQSLVPVMTAGGHQFTTVRTAYSHTCGVTVSGSVYCWGLNQSGQLGNGSRTSSAVPVAVVGGLLFSDVVVGSYHACALTTERVLYCWGSGASLGHGSSEMQTSPTKVAGQP